jgi:endonuclease YncB( thermonuclease family)
MMKAVIFSLLLSWSIQAATITGKVVSVADGDTITVLDATKKQHKIRFYGIDTPETAQAFGAKAKQFTSSLCFGKQVSVDIRDTDRIAPMNGPTNALTAQPRGFFRCCKPKES